MVKATVIHDTIKPIKDDAEIKIDSIRWINVRDRIILGCETGTYNTWFTFKNITDNHPDSLGDFNNWMFKSGYTPLSNSYYLATQYGKFSFYSHRILPNSAISGHSTSRYVSFGYSHLFKNINVGVSYKNIESFMRTNHILYDNLFINDTLINLSAKDFRFTIELISKHNFMFKKYGFSNLYFPVKASVSANVMLESSLFRLSNSGKNIIPFYWWDYNVGKFFTDETKYMKEFSIFTQSLNIHLGGVLPILKKKGDFPKSLFFKINYLYGFNFFRYKNVTIDQGDIYSGFRLSMANSAGTGQLTYADKNVHISAGFYMRVIKFNELQRKDELSLQFYTYYLFVNAGYRIPFTKGYEKINCLF